MATFWENFVGKTITAATRLLFGQDDPVAFRLVDFLKEIPLPGEDYRQDLLDYSERTLQGLPVGMPWESIGGLSSLIGFVMAFATAGVKPFGNLISYGAFKNIQTERVDPATLSLLHTYNLISDDDYITYMQEYGFNTAQQNYSDLAVAPRLSKQELIRMSWYNSGLDFTTELLDQYYPAYDMQQDMFVDAMRPLPASNEVIRAYLWIIQNYITANSSADLTQSPFVTLDDNFLPDIQTQLARAGYNESDLALLSNTVFQPAPATDIIAGMLYSGHTYNNVLVELARTGIDPNHLGYVLESLLLKLHPLDYARINRRMGLDDEYIKKDLTRFGVHPQQTDLYMEASYSWPAVQDLITMAVREVFTPEVAARYGQFEDYPPQFEDEAKRIGLSSYWAKNYWAAHWALPGAQQGFEMLHRGIINENELRLLLRTLDIMPYWRDRLIEISYNPLTRVDVRRMYRTGTLSLQEVYYAYLDVGFNPDRAELMTDFTHRFVIEQVTGFKPKNIIDAFSDGILSRNIAVSLLQAFDMPDDFIDIAIDRATLDREIDQTKLKVTNAVNMYVKGLIDDIELLTRLNRLPIDKSYQNIVTEQAIIKREAKLKLPTKAEIIRMLRGQIISVDEAQERFRKLGYMDEDIVILTSEAYLNVDAAREGTYPSKADILSFFKAGKIDQAKARDMLLILGYRIEHIELYLT